METSNFWRAGKHYDTVAISIGIPSWYKGRRCLDLAPSRAMLKMTAEEYDEHYAAKLARLDPVQIYNRLGKDAILLCWEKPFEKCHRRWVAEWLEEALGIEIPEMGFPRKVCPRYVDLRMPRPKEEEVAQGQTLFTMF